ncbi:MAG TPA: dephospho-CoA kinase [Spirochaetia bacterium]|nr:dephospho-CoA kinase [Spirochaetia bacterium]
MIVGLAGKACAGKDALVPFFADRGFTVIDADRLGHAALEANREVLVARFGTIDRAALGKIVFSDPSALADLEAVSHPWIAGEVRRLVAAAPGDVVINAALLHKLDTFRLCDLVVWVQAPLWTRVFRARRRDGWTWGRIFTRIWAQRKLGPQVFPKDVDILRVDNRGSLRRARRTLETRFGPGTVLPK